MSTTEQAVDYVLANHAAQKNEDVALNDDEGVALDLDEPKRCLQTEKTRQVDDGTGPGSCHPRNWPTAPRGGDRATVAGPLGRARTFTRMVAKARLGFPFQSLWIPTAGLAS